MAKVETMFTLRHTYDRTISIVSKSLFKVVSDEVLNLTLRLQDIKKTKD